MLKYRLWRIKQSFASQTDKTLKYKRLNIEVEQQSTKIVNLVGYIILAVVLINYAFLLVSAQFSNSNWVHATAGNLIENGWGLLLGFLFIFYRRDQDIVKSFESFWLSALSWLALVIGIGYFIITPLIITNSFRITREYKAQITGQIDAANSQVKQYAQQLDKASEEQLTGLLQNYQQQAPEIAISSSQQLKETLVKQVQQRQNQAQQKIKTEFSQQKKDILKTTIKWSMTGILTGTCFMLIWKYTTWARVKF